ncbi:HCL558Cp [Eremothecium sinecaudum]|uniref:HCL558Cp n=1 Tax=Eremothecium sinecaudum TaxID=45286 RepID=A0A109UXY8_9SACH|nr:HCL558Cp [Eremothecium sinecaudum]AMD19593.1 HCL558Cp [Eremothecium sinecaudum]
MLSATTWIPRGFASEFPEKYELDDVEMERINQLAKLNLEDAKQDLMEADDKESGGKKALDNLKSELEMDDDLKEFDMENYDNDADGEEIAMFPGLPAEATFHEGDDENDPYISLPTKDDEHEEKQELQIYPTDNLVLATRTEDDISYLDVYVYDDGAGFHDGDIPTEEGDEKDPDVARGLIRDPSLYVHHDLMLPAFPLCVEWINYKPGSSSDNIANFAAVGTFDPSIEIWNLDCVDKAFPDMILGESGDAGAGRKKSKKKGKKHITTHHTDAVLSLAHNKQFRAVLASTSADHTVKLWDLNNGSAAQSIPSIHGSNPVASSQWHPTDGSVLLTGGYDSRVALSDVRISNDSEMSKYWSVSSGEDVENVCFANENVFMAGTDNGNVYAFDLRNGENGAPIWTLKAHDAGISSLSINSSVPDMLITSAVGEKIVKLWKAPVSGSNDEHKGPHMVLSRDFGVGNVLSTSFAPDLEVNGTIVVGGVNPGLKLWDVFTNRSVRKSFANELKEVKQKAREEARKLGRSSRFSRKYIINNNADTVLTVDDLGEDEEEQEES